MQWYQVQYGLQTAWAFVLVGLEVLAVIGFVYLIGYLIGDDNE